jgi:hypothetical protein
MGCFLYCLDRHHKSITVESSGRGVLALSRCANRGVPELADGPTLEVGRYLICTGSSPVAATIMILDSSSKL